MANTIVTQEEMTLRRRARRRLVGAVAIALAAFLILPILFDPDPKPLGPDVDIRIPPQDSPFDTPSRESPVAMTPAEEDLPTQEAEPTQPPPAVPPPPPIAAEAKTPPPPVAAEAKPTPPQAARPVASKPEAPAVKLETAKAPPPPPSAPPPPQADDARAYYLQLGAFSSEANARALEKKARAAGFEASISGGNGQFRVRVGPISGHDAARVMQNRMRARGFAPVILGA